MISLKSNSFSSNGPNDHRYQSEARITAHTAARSRMGISLEAFSTSTFAGTALELSFRSRPRVESSGDDQSINQGPELMEVNSNSTLRLGG